MASWISIDLPGGHKGAGLSDSAGPWVVLHINALDLPDDELVQAIRSCADAAWHAEALNCADWITLNNRGLKPWSISPDVVTHKELLQQYIDRSPLIVEALSIIETYQWHEEQRSKKPAKRREIRRNYDTLFVAIGKRDGFHCLRCRSTTDLQIDHRRPLALGGTNDLDNLQLLCGSCNLSKGASDG